LHNRTCLRNICMRTEPNEDPNLKYLTLLLNWFPKENCTFFLRYLVVTNKDASNNTVKYLKLVSVWFRSHANVAQACSIVLSAHQVIMPIHSRRSDPQAPPGEGLTPHTIHQYSYGPLQAPLPLPSKEEEDTLLFFLSPEAGILWYA
jgi:hypothetical protein